MSDPRSALNIPIPDPSLLTTEQFNRGQDVQRRELSSVREFLLSEMGRIEKVHEEKFRSIEIRFGENKTALDAALKAAQNLVDAQNRSNVEASEKSERSFTKQIEALDQQTKTITASQSREINDLKERLVGGESRSSGATDNTARLMTAVMFILTLGMMLYTVMSHNSQSPTVISPAVVPLKPSGP